MGIDHLAITAIHSESAELRNPLAAGLNTLHVLRLLVHRLAEKEP
jgi:hypothetical protein